MKHEEGSGVSVKMKAKWERGCRNSGSQSIRRQLYQLQAQMEEGSVRKERA